MIRWSTDSHDLPVCTFTGALPCRAVDREGKAAKIPADPWFLLGNYRTTLFAHVSGEMEWLSGERAWGRLNQGPRPNSGLNRASVKVSPDPRTLAAATAQSLIGIDTIAADPARCKRSFGCGHADYHYQLDRIDVTRRLALAPSRSPQDGVPAVLVTVTLQNTAAIPLSVSYEEGLTARYEMSAQQRQTSEERRARYYGTPHVDAASRTASVVLRGEAEDPDLAPDRDTRSRWELFPPALFLHLLKTPDDILPKTDIRNDGVEVSFTSTVCLEPGATVTLQFVLGHTWDIKPEALVADLLSRLDGEADNFAAAWSKVLPAFSSESSNELRRELRWHAYVLEAMATYSAATGESRVPQGTIYDYDWGLHASARDHFQHALPLCRTNPALARSVLRHLAARTSPEGFIRLCEIGFAVPMEAPYLTSDQQLFYFQLVGEYLAATGDLGFLLEDASSSGSGARTGLDTLEACFRHLRDEIGVGDHGLVRLLNSDWNDAVFYIVKAPYNRVLFTGESHLNTALALTVLPAILVQLDAAASDPRFHSGRERIARLRSSIAGYCTRLEAAFLTDLGERAFPRRMYFAGNAYGEDNMFLEPQAFALQLASIPPDRKAALYREVQARLFENEKIAARQQQAPEFVDEAFDYGSRENGGIWWSLNGPLILGVATFDLEEAWRLFHRTTLAHVATAFPDFWPGLWSSSDNVESSLIPAEGLPDQSDCYADQPVYCAHQHAWVLYCYQRLSELSQAE